MGDEPDRVALVSDLRLLRSELSERIDRLEEKLTKRIASEGKTTRRHFKIMVEEVKAAVKLVAEVNAHHAVVLDNHETRLTQIEKTR